jgi:pyruvate/2-oxoglutarate dehydrogenase complex dihydrolipoamide acyltransferase (E2) component
MTVRDLTRWQQHEDGSWTRLLPDEYTGNTTPQAKTHTQPETEAPADELAPVQATAGAITLAQQLGLDLRTIEGTGTGGKVTKADVQNAA